MTVTLTAGTSLQNAINTAISLGEPLYIPAGTYGVPATITATVNGSLVIQGDGRGLSVIQALFAAGDVLQLTGGGRIELRDVTFTSAVPRTSGAFLNTTMTQVELQRVSFDSYLEGWVSNDIIVRGRSLDFSKGVVGQGIGITGNGWGGACVLDDLLMVPAGMAMQPAAGIKIVQAGACQLVNSNIMQQGVDLLIAPGPGQAVTDMFVTACYFDTANTGLTIAPSGGSVTRLKFGQCWFSSHAGEGVSINNSGTGTIAGIDFTDCHMLLNASAGLGVTGATDVSLIGSKLASNAFGAWFTAINGLTIDDNTIGAYGGLPGNSQWGLVLTPGSTSYSVVNNRMVGNIYGGLLDQANWSGRNVSGNLTS